MAPLESLRAADLSSVIGAFRDLLRSHQDLVNRLNVYPVPDGDTGTNMALTLESVVSELGEDDDLAAVCKAIAHGSLMGARGNSGVILSQLLRGITDGLLAGAADGMACPAAFARALAEADRLAREAVMRPVEGTILTVARGAAEGAAAAAAEGGDLCDVAEAARTGAQVALDGTPQLLPVLAQAGVVDAGGTGYVLFFDAVLHVVDGRPLPRPPDLPALPDNPPGIDAVLDDAVAAAHGDLDATGATGLRYEVMYLLEAADDTIAAFKEVWAGVGDSIVVVGGDGLWNCHIHTDDIGASVEACLDAGRPRNIRVTDLIDQVIEERWVREGAARADAGPPEVPTGPPPQTGVVAVATGDGIKRIFRSLGVHGIIGGGQSMNPSTRDILDAVEALASDEVVILPNNKNIRPVAEQVGELCSKSVRVIPTNTVAEGFAALLAYDPAAHVDENAVAMEGSARKVVPGEVTRAVRDADSPAGPIKEGDWLGLSRLGIEVRADTLPGAACDLLDALVTDEHELVTVIEGDGSGAAATRTITEWLAEHRPGADVEVHHGGQPLYPYLFSIE